MTVVILCYLWLGPLKNQILGEKTAKPQFYSQIMAKKEKKISHRDLNPCLQKEEGLVLPPNRTAQRGGAAEHALTSLMKHSFEFWWAYVGLKSRKVKYTIVYLGSDQQGDTGA